MKSVGKIPAKDGDGWDGQCHGKQDKMLTYQLVSSLVHHPQISGETNGEVGRVVEVDVPIKEGMFWVCRTQVE
jgi:hypothetical protein